MEEAAPAGTNKVYYDGCPGCAMDRRKESRAGVPYKELLFVAAATFASALPITSLFPFLYFMIRDLRVAEREEDIGFYAGFLGAAYMIGRGVASVFWGVVADRVGRKPVIAFSVLSVVVFNTLFGLSAKYWMAIATRFLLGALNGFLAPAKAYSIEVCRPEQQALGISVVSTAWGMGVIIGPAIGGYLAQVPVPVAMPVHLVLRRLGCHKLRMAPGNYNLETLHKHRGLERAAAEMAEGTTAAAAQESTPEPEPEPPKSSLLRNRPLMSSIVSYCVFSLHDTAYVEIFSLWTVSGRDHGGLSFASKDVGQVLTVAGASLLVYQIFAYRWVNKILGPVNSTRVSSALSIPIIAAYPFMTRLSGIRLGVPLYVAAMLKSVLAITRVTGTSLLQNNAVPQEQRGAANGIATTAMSLSKAFAPAVAGILFSWAQKRQHAAFFPGDQMVFLLLNLTEVIGLVLTFKPFLAVPQQYKQ
ncbi:Protein ZINC INDUCED FACILITATOR-LIKE 1 [Zea mays]|uniref:Protein ZINC INDUCED FACILITATOR-LIKE 1 n=1 Tax=Zea mays TaxID=4577 RepID=A0A3L6F345_MAIZE|nr:Protein ZINC INDUCED FACILITATOR-LIKE 1 [Zea mays]